MTIKELAHLLTRISPKMFDMPVHVHVDGHPQVRSITAAMSDPTLGILLTACNCQACQQDLIANNEKSDWAANRETLKSRQSASRREHD